MKKTTWSLLLLLAMPMWAAFYPFTKLIEGTIEPLQLTFLRYFGATVALLPFALKQKAKTWPRGKEWWMFLLLAFFTVMPTALTATGMKVSNSIVASILVNTSPLFIAGLAPLMIAEKISLKTFGAILIGIIGIFLTVLNGNSVFAVFASSHFSGSIYFLLAATLIALFGIYAKKYSNRYGGILLAFITISSGTVIIGSVLAANGALAGIPGLPLRTLVFALLNGVIATAIPYAIWNSSLKHVRVSTASTFKLLIPVFATLYSFAFLHEALTAWTLLGMGITGLSVYLVQR